MKRNVSGNDRTKPETDEIMIKKSKLKRTLAREILFFFAGIFLIGLVWGFLLIQNSYYEKKASSSSDKIKTLQVQSYKLPKDYIKEFYDQTNRYFVVNYRLGQDSYAIPKEQLKVFLYDEFGIKKNTILIPNHPKGYSSIKTNCVTIKPKKTIYFSSKEDLGKQVKKLYSQYADIDDYKLGNKVLKKFNQYTDSIVAFDFVSIDKFSEFVSSDDYLNKLYSVFANSSDKDKWVPPLDAVRANFDPMKPYNSTFQLGTLSEFKAKMKIGLKFNSTVVKKKNKIETDIADLKETITNSQKNKLTSIEIRQSVIYSAILIGLLLYVLRLSIVLLVWALRTMNQDSV